MVLILPSTQYLLWYLLLSHFYGYALYSCVYAQDTFSRRFYRFPIFLSDINLIFLIHIITILCKRNNNTLTVLKLPTLNIEKLNA